MTTRRNARGSCATTTTSPSLGVPGSTLMNRYVSGDNVHTGTITDGKEWGRESELGYTVQSGTLRSQRQMAQLDHADFSNNEFDENRLIVSYPISLLWGNS